MRIAIAQINTRAGDFEATAQRMEAFSQSAAEQGADLLVFPLAALTGMTPPDFANQEGFLLDLSETLVRLSDGLACPCVVPVVTDMDDTPFPEAMLLRDGEVMPLRLLSYYERQSPHAGPPAPAHDGSAEVTTFELGGLRFALAFTYDDLDDLLDASAEADVVLYVSGYGFALDDTGSALGASLGESRFRADARALDSWLVAVGSLGGYGMQVFTGSSFVQNPQGELVASAPAFEDALLVAEVGTGDGPGEQDALEPELYDRSLHLWEALSLGLRDYLHKQGGSDVALVLDGSLGSCVLAALATDALGPTHVHAVCGVAASDGRLGTVQRLAEALHVELSDGGEGLVAVADESVLADLSQVRLAQVARATGSLAISHEDKTFLALEASGTTCRAAALLPLGDVYRTDVMELAHLRNTISPVIPAEALAAYAVPRVAGLEQAEPTPEARLRRVDVTLATHVEWERSLSDVVARQGEPVVSEAIVRLLHATEARRVPMPPYLMMSSRTLFDARTPLGLAWHDRVREQDERLRGEAIMDRISSLLDEGEQGDDRPRAESSPAPDLSALLEGLDLGEMEGSLGELFSLLQDLAQSGGLSMEHVEGPFGPSTWGSPFSEN